MHGLTMLHEALFDDNNFSNGALAKRSHDNVLGQLPSRCHTFDTDSARCVTYRSKNELCRYLHEKRSCVKQLAAEVPVDFGCTAEVTFDNKPRVAVCLTGHARTFLRPHVRASILRNLLWQRAAQAQIDVFAIISAGDSYKRMGGWNTSLVMAADDAELAASVSSLSPRVFQIVRRPWLQPNPSCNVSSAYFRRNHERVLAQPSAWAQCYDNIERAERADGAMYDWVMRTRPDAFWYSPHPRLCRPREHLHPIVLNAAPFLDNHFVLPRSAAYQVMRHMAMGYTRCNTTWELNSLEHRLFVYAHETAVRLNVPLERWAFPMTVVRSSAAEPHAAIMGCQAAHTPVICMRLAYPHIGIVRISSGDTP